jgi:hypothetical protein
MHVIVFATGSKLTEVVRVRLHPHVAQTPGRVRTITEKGCAPGAAGTIHVSAQSRADRSHVRGICDSRQQAAAIASGQ